MVVLAVRVSNHWKIYFESLKIIVKNWQCLDSILLRMILN